MSAHDRFNGDQPDEQDALAAGRDVIRQVRDAGREAVREARRAARDSNRRARESVMQSVRDARATARAAARAQEHHGPGHGRESDTRSKIQQVGLRLFTEHGYEATSLREIAEELGVTKAALYYHFRSKDEIINSLAQERFVRVEDLIDWGQGQPRSVATRRELLRRYSELLYEHDHRSLMHFFERNQSSMTQHPVGAQMRDQMSRLRDLFMEPDAPLTAQIRSSMAIFVLHSVWFTLRDRDIDDDEVRDAALEVALELVE
jgi:AcrR family transcriptional regulator